MMRHGETTANRDGIFSGRHDVELTTKGKEQAQKARSLITKKKIIPNAIIHSHLQRAKNTAQIVNENLNAPLLENSKLAEQHFGDWELGKWVDLKPLFENGIEPPNGETNEKFLQRLKQGFIEALEIYEEPLLVTHGGVFRGLFKLLNHPHVSVRNCELYFFEPYKNNWKIKLIK